MAGLPKKYAKMGFKRGWAAFNKSKRKGKSTKKVVYKMARRRKGGYRKRRYSRKSGGLGMGNITKVLIGAGMAALYEVFVSPMIPLDGLIKNVAEFTAGILLAAMPGLPMPVKAFGAALATINAYSMIVSFLPSGQGAASGSSW